MAKLAVAEERRAHGDGNGVGEGCGFGGIVGRSEAIRKQIELARKYAASDCTVLILGESGTGKEVFAKAIHEGGARAAGQFVPLNCAGFTDELLENELFGHEPGAYTGARGGSSGLVVEAEGGTLFLDEVDSLTLPAQAKLLRFLQDRNYRPIGGRTLRHADVRIIAATNGDLAARVADGRFRQDLFYRLAVLRLWLPPLRDRPEDIPLLVRFLVEKHFGCGRRGNGAPSEADLGVQNAESSNVRGTIGIARTISDEAMRALQSYHWPGNVRELENVIQRALVMAAGAVIEATDLGIEIESAGIAEPGRYAEEKRRAIEEFNRSYLEKLMARADGNVTLAAQLAGKERRTLYQLLRKCGFVRSRCAANWPGEESPMNGA